MLQNQFDRKRCHDIVLNIFADYEPSSRAVPFCYGELCQSNYSCCRCYSTVDNMVQSSTGFFGRISNAIQNITGNKVIVAADLDPILHEFKTMLLLKNVASGVVDSLVASVKESLIGTKTESFTSVKNALKLALVEAMQRILTQRSSIDVLKMANEAKEKGSVFSICFLVSRHNFFQYEPADRRRYIFLLPTKKFDGTII